MRSSVQVCQTCTQTWQRLTTKAEVAKIVVVPFVEDFIGRTRELFPDRPILLDTPRIGREFEAHLDADMTELALVNLIENSDKFSPQGTPITVGIGRADGVFAIWVADQGIGIPLDEQDLLTHKFFRASNSGGTSGLGIGLHIVHAAAKAQGGHLRIDSTEGHGTTVTINLPSFGSVA